MSDSNVDEGLIRSVWEEARDLVRRLEGSSVQRFAVQAGDTRIEIERGAPAPVAAPQLDGADGAAPPPMAVGAGPGMGVDPGARGASGAFAAIDPSQMDNRIPVLAPLVGTYYSASQPGAKAFAEVGDVVEGGQTVCIVEAMKLMNEVAATEKGKVAEITCKDGDWVEFEQVLMYLEPVD